MTEIVYTYEFLNPYMVERTYTFPFDVLDIVSRTTPEQFLQIIKTQEL